MEHIIRYPDYITVETENWKKGMKMQGEVFSLDHVQIGFEQTEEELEIFCTAENERVRMIQLRWEMNVPEHTEFLGDEWERTYGQTQWMHMNGCRFMPWYFLADDGREVWGYGVKVRPSAMCMWSADKKGVTLYLDVRCGGTGVLLKGRKLKAAQIVSRVYNSVSAFEAARQFCAVLCEDPILPDNPVYGSNNWYYAYGDSSEGEILSDARYLADLTEGIKNRPYLVIDDCWQEHHRLDEYNGGPWRKGNEKFPDMKNLADQIKEMGLHTGIWVRFLLNEEENIEEGWRLSHNGCLDPSHPQVKRYIEKDIETICEWGFQLIKHDFSTYDILGKWGFQMQPLATEYGWHFYEEGRTTAEIIVDFYQLILDASRSYKTLILGCNTIGHLGAGLMHMNRTGDDTSGFVWERTRKMGVNTLAFRMPHHRTFYDIDADCVGINGEIKWKYNRQWAELLAKSGTSLFLSVKPGILTEDEERDVKEFYRLASLTHTPAEPLDWQNTNCPSKWKMEDGIREYEWYEKSGVSYRTEPETN